MIGRPSKFLYHISEIVLVDIVDRWLMLGVLILIRVESGSGFLDDGIGDCVGFRDLMRKLMELFEILISIAANGVATGVT